MSLKKYSVSILFLIVFFKQALSQISQEDKFDKAKEIAEGVRQSFINLFHGCMSTTMSNQFSIDNLQNYVNSESKTTVGFAPKFTTNRRFFANMIGTPQFKNMLDKDEEELRQSFVKKMKHCDEVAMDKDLLKEFYDKDIE